MLFPYKDINPSRRFPIFVLSIIFINIFAFILELEAGRNVETMIKAWGFIPYELFYHDIPPYTGFSPFVNIFTSMFLHGGFLHIAGNMLFLWIFGDNVEDYFGHIKFLFFYFACGCAAALTQALLSPSSIMPMVGASGAISGVLGAYLYLYPWARIRSIFWFFIFIERIEVPAGFYLAFWFIFQILGLANTANAGIAFGAHTGGFIAGLLITARSYRKRLKKTQRFSRPI